MIRFTHVSKAYARTGLALRDVSFHVAKGEFVFLTGPSGAGKSTLLKLVYMEERPSEGEVRVGGYSSRDVGRRDVALMRRKLGVVFQDFRLLEDRSAEANVAFALEVTGSPVASIGPRVAQALARVGLAGKGTALPSQLSGGEQQRVAIARALVNNPVVLIADEPTGNLDERATRGIVQLLEEINASGTAVVMATHDMGLIRRSGRRVLELEGGRMISDGHREASPSPGVLG
ncbi:MAG TPA: cell division ATP-binding protein FtsE [Gemmatimonadaceae bacterium]|nr:cell division ATP-binding protein FtsE [Gemmatimonadaceae bacterium]